MTTVQKSKTHNQIEMDVKQAMKCGDATKRDTLRQVLDKIQKKAKEERVSFIDEEQAIQVLQSYKKQVQEELIGFEKAGRLEKVADLQAELSLITSYLPAQMSEEEIQRIVHNIIDELGEKAELGTVMKRVMSLVKGKADNKVVSQIIKTELL